MLGRVGAGQQPQADAERFLVHEVARTVQEVLGRQGGIERARDPRREAALVRPVAENRGVDRGIEQVRPARDGPGQPGRAAENVAEQVAQARVRS